MMDFYRKAAMNDKKIYMIKLEDQTPVYKPSGFRPRNHFSFRGGSKIEMEGVACVASLLLLRIWG